MAKNFTRGGRRLSVALRCFISYFDDDDIHNNKNNNDNSNNVLIVIRPSI